MSSILARLNGAWQARRQPRRAAKAVALVERQLRTEWPDATGRIGRYNAQSAARLGWTPAMLRETFPDLVVAGWDDADGFGAVQAALGVAADGWFGAQSHAALMKSAYGDCLIVAGRPHRPPAGVEVRNWYAPGAGVSRFPGSDRRGRTVDMVVCHESVTSSWEGTQRVLTRRGLGVHLIVTEARVDGKVLVTQHGDLAWDRLAHAGGQNGPSVGLEFVNPYEPSMRAPWHGEPVIRDVPWAWKGAYQMLPLAMLEAGTALLAWLTDEEGPVGIPSTWRGHDKKNGRFALSRVPGSPRRSGVWAHTYTAHADAAIPVLFAWLRMEHDLKVEEACKEAVWLASVPNRWAGL